MPYEKPLPRPTGDTKLFWEACKKHELQFQRCSGCGYIRWPCSIICPQCYSQEAEWFKISGKGKVYTFTVMHGIYHKGFTNEAPYVVAIIELDEGPFFLSNIVGCKPQDVLCDMPVEVSWENAGEFCLPKFKPLSR